MRVFVYEYLTALGIGRAPADPMRGMYREGRAMREAAIADFKRIDGTEVIALDPVLAEAERREFQKRAQDCDFTLVIAPEFNGILQERCRWVESAGGCLLGPALEATQRTADKLKLARHWSGHSVPTPVTLPIEEWPRNRTPAVFKPRDGAGSTATYLAEASHQLVACRADAQDEYEGQLIAQDFVPGRAASVAFLCGPHGNVPLVPAFQHLSTDGRCHYLGGELPIPPLLAERAVNLASRALGWIAGLNGYVGVDLVLGNAPDGSQDFAIEINPRLTTSYLGLRAFAEFNLAEALLKTANGQAPSALRWKRGSIRFTPEGAVELADPG